MVAANMEEFHHCKNYHILLEWFVYDIVTHCTTFQFICTIVQVVQEKRSICKKDLHIINRHFLGHLDDSNKFTYFFLPVVLVFLVLELADKAVELEDLLARQEFQFPK